MPSIKTTDFSGQSFYIGLDVHKKSWSVTVRTLGLEVAHFSQSADADQLVKYLYKRYPGGEFVSAYEAGFSGTSVHHRLLQAGLRNIIIHPADLPLTDKHKKNKTDSHDSRATARYLEAGVLKGIYIMSDEQQELRSLFRLHQSKVRDVTRANNRLKSFLHYYSIQFPERMQNPKYLSNAHLNWLRTYVPKTQQGVHVLQQYIDDLQYHRQQLALLTKKLRTAVATAFPEQYRCVKTITGIGPITAIALLTEMGDPDRFDQRDQFCSWLGLVPSEQSSGGVVYSVKTQSRCNKHLRPLLIEAAWVAIRHSPKLLAYYRKHVAKDNKKAIVKVAAKLALIALAVIRNKMDYNPER